MLSSLHFLNKLYMTLNLFYNILQDSVSNNFVLDVATILPPAHHHHTEAALSAICWIIAMSYTS